MTLAECPIAPPLGWGSQKPPVGAHINRSHPLANGLLSYFAFNEASGLGMMDAMSQKSAAIVGGKWRGGKRGAEVLLNGTSDYVDYSNTAKQIPYLACGSVSFWFRWDGSASVTCPWYLGRYNNNYHESSSVFFGASTGNYTDESILFTYYDASDGNPFTMLIRKGETFYRDGLWHHLVVVVDGISNRMYVDGVRQTMTFKDGSATSRVFFTPTVSFASYGYIGKRTSSGPLYFQGAIADVGLWSRGLSDADVQTLYAQPYAPFESGGIETFDDDVLFRTNRLRRGSRGVLA